MCVRARLTLHVGASLYSLHPQHVLDQDDDSAANAGGRGPRGVPGGKADPSKPQGWKAALANFGRAGGQEQQQPKKVRTPAPQHLDLSCSSR